jgi:hypothetical protein
MKKVSKMLIDVSGDFITGETEKEELAIRADIAMTAWNIAILPKSHRRDRPNCFTLF